MARSSLWRWSPHAAVAAVAVLCVGAAVLGSVQSPGGTAQGGPSGPPGSLTVADYSCGQNWASARPGPQSVLVYNAGDGNTDVDLISPSTGAIYGEVEAVGPTTTGTIRVDLGDGDYALRCLPEDHDSVVGPTVRVVGASGPGTPGVVAVTKNDLIGPTKQYQDHVLAGLGTLAPEVAAVRADIASGDLGSARTDWLVAHLQYERLGGAYDAFGDLGGAIDGRPDGLPLGVNDPNWTGFLRLEYGLWHGQSAAPLQPVADQLVADVGRLHTTFADQEIDPLQIGLRAHEILENALQFELSGSDDEGSGTNLATVSANVDGTRELLGVLQPILATRYPALPQVGRALDRLEADLAAQQSADGSWTPVEQLPPAQHEELDSATSAAVELLAPVATICEPRRT